MAMTNKGGFILTITTTSARSHINSIAINATKLSKCYKKQNIVV